MTAIDTSVCVPALASWHEQHTICRKAAAGASMPGHALLETYSVLTRMPAPLRLPADTAQDLLHRWFPRDRVLAASAALQRDALGRLHAAGISGGAVYDGLIALIVKEHGECLLTFDQRALRTYEALGIDFELIEP